MTETVQQNAQTRKIPWRIIGWGGAVALILSPLVAMQFTREVNWTGGDFIAAAVIFGVVGALAELTMWLSSSWLVRAGALLAILAGFALVWSNLAVGMIGNEHNPVNQLFFGVLVVAIAGAGLSRLYPGALAAAMLIAGTLQASIGLFAGILGSDHRGGVFTIILSSLWLLAGVLLWLARARRA